MIKYLATYLVFAQFSFTVAQANDASEQDVNAVLDQFHSAAAVADIQVYFDSFSENATFLGTDVSEVWDVSTYREIVQNSGTKGWVYLKRERNITIAPDGASAWFNEVLDSVKYGTSRGTGTLIKTARGWKIVQYHLSFPIPNDLSAEFTTKIRTYEKMKEKQITK